MTLEEALGLARQRFPKESNATQEAIAAHALIVMDEPRWAKFIHPMTAVKIAGVRIKNR